MFHDFNRTTKPRRYFSVAQLWAISQRLKKERDKDMSSKMSHDRVSFILPRKLMERNFQAYNQLFRMAFGTCEITNRGDLAIVCRPSQFARFLIHRNNMIQEGTLSGCNTFSEMKPKLFTPDLPVSVHDVSKNPHCG